MNTTLKKTIEALKCNQKYKYDLEILEILDAIADRLPEDEGPTFVHKSWIPCGKGQGRKAIDSWTNVDASVTCPDCLRLMNSDYIHYAGGNTGIGTFCGKKPPKWTAVSAKEGVTCLDCLKLMKAPYLPKVQNLQPMSPNLRPIHIWRTGNFTLCNTALVDCAGIVLDKRHSTCERCIEMAGDK